MRKRESPSCIICGEPARLPTVPCAKCRPGQLALLARVREACPEFADEREARIVYYQSRVERGLPLFGGK